MSGRIAKVLRDLHPNIEAKVGSYDSDGKTYCGQDSLECVRNDCRPDTCMFYGISTVPVKDWVGVEDNAGDPMGLPAGSDVS